MTLVTLAIEDGVATVTMASPATRNALDIPLLGELASHLEQAEQDPSVSVIALCAEGPVFSVGGSIDMFAESGDRIGEVITEVGALVNRAVLAMDSPAKLTVTSARGAVGGGAIGLLAAADVALASEATTFALGYGALANSPDAGVSWFLSRDCGHRRALELYLSNRRFNAAEAASWGLINRAVADDALDADAAETARSLAAGPARALIEGRRLFRTAAGTALADHLEDEIETFVRNTGAAEFAEGVSAFRERRQPRWPSPPAEVAR